MQPSLIVYDVETTGLNFWEADFRVLSCAFAWSKSDGQVVTRYLEGEDEIGKQLQLIADAGIPLAAHNLAFEYGVTRHRFPSFPLKLLQVDTMRLVQVYDNGSSRVKLTGPMSLEDEIAELKGELKVSNGLGLEAATSRLLPKEYHDHKQPYYKWLRANGVKAGQEGANLHLLPPEMFEAYNVADAIITLELYKATTSKFAADGYDWTFDHRLHLNAIKRIVESKARGIRVAREELAQSQQAKVLDIEATKLAFTTRFAEPIGDIVANRWDAWVNEPKTERGKERRAAEPMPESLQFNSGSTTQLRELFVDTLGVQPTFFTKEGKASQAKRKADPSRPPFVPKPSFRAAHLPSYGEGGAMLQTVKKRQLVALQMEKLLEKSAADGRWKVDLRACGTKTGRYTGGGGLNIQALARREKDLMGRLLPEPDHTFVSVDLSAGEPTVIAHYSQDTLYNAATFGMVGRAPYYDGKVLLIDDIYTMFASVSPLAKDAVKQAWDEGKFEGWETKDDNQRKAIAPWRPMHKTIFLAKVYGQGARGTVNFAADQGYSLDFQTSKQLHQNVWYDLFPRVRMLGERLEQQFKQKKSLVNEFGYRMVPERESLCLNYLIQSSVSGIMKVFEDMVLERAPWAIWTTCIHDESIWQVPTERVEEFRRVLATATDELNAYLNWSVKIRTGFVTGSNLHEAK